VIMMNNFIPKKLREKYRRKYEIVESKDYSAMESEAMKKLRSIIPELYEKFLEEEFGKWVQVYMD
jgi:hypothetical protein